MVAVRVQVAGTQARTMTSPPQEVGLRNNRRTWFERRNGGGRGLQPDIAPLQSPKHSTLLYNIEMLGMLA
jgi:hypothetical protein